MKKRKPKKPKYRMVTMGFIYWGNDYWSGYAPPIGNPEEIIKRIRLPIRGAK